VAKKKVVKKKKKKVATPPSIDDGKPAPKLVKKKTPAPPAPTPEPIPFTPAPPTRKSKDTVPKGTSGVVKPQVTAEQAAQIDRAVNKLARGGSPTPVNWNSNQSPFA
jgi:hypothetical protein